MNPSEMRAKIAERKTPDRPVNPEQVLAAVSLTLEAIEKAWDGREAVQVNIPIREAATVDVVVAAIERLGALGWACSAPKLAAGSWTFLVNDPEEAAPSSGVGARE